MRTFCPKIHVRSFVRTFLGLLDVWSVMRTGKSDLNADGTAEKNRPVHKERIDGMESAGSPQTTLNVKSLIPPT
jgi:hypothetical protein